MKNLKILVLSYQFLCVVSNIRRAGCEIEKVLSDKGGGLLIAIIF